MKQYLELAKTVKDKGTYKAPSREGMPGTTSLFGYQFRCDLSEGFPLLTTKKVSFKNIVTELLWFLKGDTNIKYLIDNGCNIWNEDAYNYYIKQFNSFNQGFNQPLSFDEFVKEVKEDKNSKYFFESQLTNYKLGDCGKQYGWLWRTWSHMKQVNLGSFESNGEWLYRNGHIPAGVDQIKKLIKGLKEKPLSRTHIISAWNPATLDDMALNACHVLVQFNCRPLTPEQKEDWRLQAPAKVLYKTNKETGFTEVDQSIVPEYYLDCQMYQRSADLFLGVPYNISSYALLTHILCKMCNMVPGDFIHTFGDVHIYDNHMEQIDEQLLREPKDLPKIKLADWIAWETYDLDEIWDWGMQLFELENYDPHPAIKGKLSTGLK